MYLGMQIFYKTKKALGATDSEDISSIVVTRRGLYALRVGDPQKVEDFADDISSPNLKNAEDITYKEALLNLYKEGVINETIDLCGNCSNAQEEALFEMKFIDFMKNIPDIRIFRGLDDGNGNYTWQEI